MFIWVKTNFKKLKKLILEHLSVDFRKLLIWPCLAVGAIAEVVSVEQACIFRWVSNSLLHFCFFFTSAGSSRAQLHVAANQTAQIACRRSRDSAENWKEGLCGVIICVKLRGFLPADWEWFYNGAQPMQNSLSWEQGFEPWLSLKPLAPRAMVSPAGQAAELCPTGPAQGRNQQLNSVCLRGSNIRVWFRLKEVFRSQHLPSCLGLCFNDKALAGQKSVVYC